MQRSARGEVSWLVGEDGHRWPAVHLLCASHFYTLALEKAKPSVDAPTRRAKRTEQSIRPCDLQFYSTAHTEEVFW